SKDNPRKRILGDLELVKWWQRALEFALEYGARSTLDKNNPPSACPEPVSACSRTAVANCIVPGSTMGESPWFFGNNSGSCNERSKLVDWKWGLPYPLSARAHDCVLQFPDDPITRLLAEAHSSSWSVSALLDMLSVSEECGSGHRTAYFLASLPLYSGVSVQASDIADSSTASQGHLSFDDYDKILIALFNHEMDFSNPASAHLSSNRLFNYLDGSYDIPVIDVETVGPATTRDTAQAEKPRELPTVNDLSAMVRKKRKVVS
ncbi:hypothetical protein FBU31_007687, partial [Coemansia sp. 'formosensis']